jgi:hypothetical protein
MTINSDLRLSLVETTQGPNCLPFLAMKHGIMIQSAKSRTQHPMTLIETPTVVSLSTVTAQPVARVSWTLTTEKTEDNAGSSCAFLRLLRFASPCSSSCYCSCSSPCVSLLLLLLMLPSPVLTLSRHLPRSAACSRRT